MKGMSDFEVGWRIVVRTTAFTSVLLGAMFGFAIQASAQNTPTELLSESLALAKQRTDRGETRTMGAMRLGATFRMAGLKSEAKVALEECAALVAQDSNADSRDETKVELAREFLLLGDMDRAYALASELTEREYGLLACFIFAREALEMSDSPGAERGIRRALEIVKTPGRKIDLRMGSSLLCAIGRIANAIKQTDLARACEDVIPDPVWKSALTGDRAEALATDGQFDEAIKVAGESVDPHMAVLAVARVECQRSLGKDTRSRGVRADALLAVANRIKESDKRDFALRIAVGKLASAGDKTAATLIANEIKHPAAKFLALSPFVEESSFDSLMTLLKECPPDDRSALAEVLVVSCGKHGLAEHALKAIEHVPPGWPRVRVLCDAAKFLNSESASRLLGSAADQLSHITDSGWRCVARCQIALAAHRVGDAKSAEKQLGLACNEALKIESSDDFSAVLPQVIEAALDCQQHELATKTLNDALQRQPHAALRDVLVPLLIEAGQPDAALKEVAAAPLENDYARRFMAYRLAKAGRIAEAVKFANTLNARSRPEALGDIARAQLPDVAPPKPSSPKAVSRRVALSSHGGWFYWPHRLERAGIAWDVMPFSTPYQEGFAGLRVRYSMLGFPGAGDHLIPSSPVGVEQVRRYLRDGGGLFGICAGQLFATGHPNGHRFVPADFYYLRGNGPHQVQMTGRHPASPALPPTIIINRQNGDFMIPRPGCDVIGWYDNQNICAAVMASHYGLGRVVVSSPHPEGDNSFSPTDRLCIEVTRWILEGTR